MTRTEIENLPVAREVDVLVVGGGPAGVGAALAAARNGAKTLVVDQFNCLGGVATAGGHGHICRYNENGTDRRIVGGIADEIARRIVEADIGIRNAYGVWFEIEGLKLLLDRMAEEAGVDVLYYTFFCDTLFEDGAAAGGVIQNKTGRQVIRARRVIDCTGDGDAAFHAGCPFEIGRPSDHRCQPVTLMFTIGGVEWDRVKAFQEEYRRKNPDDPEPWKLGRLYAEAIDRGDMRPFQTGNMGWWWTPTRPDQVGVNFTHVIHVDSTKAEDLTRATIEARRQAQETIQVYRKYVPGMERCYMVSTPNTADPGRVCPERGRREGSAGVRRRHLLRVLLRGHPLHRRPGHGRDDVAPAQGVQVPHPLPHPRAARRGEHPGRRPVRKLHARRTGFDPRDGPLLGHGRSRRHRRSAVAGRGRHPACPRRGEQAAQSDAAVAAARR